MLEVRSDVGARSVSLVLEYRSTRAVAADAGGPVMGVHVERLDNKVRQSVVVDAGDSTAISIAYFTGTEAVDAGRRLVELGEELLREQSIDLERVGVELQRRVSHG